VEVVISFRSDSEEASFATCRQDSSFLDEVDRVKEVESEREIVLEIQVGTCREGGGSFRV